MLRIGSFTATSNLILAPIAGYTDLAFRRMVRSASGTACGLCHTDLINPRGLTRQTPGTLQLIQTTPDDTPLGIQLYGRDPDELAAAALWCIENRSPATIDINMGCPVDKVAKKVGAGAALMCEPEHAGRIVDAVVRAVRAGSPRVAVTVKMRLGWACGQLTATDLALRCVDAGADMVTVHGRYAEQRFSGSACLDGIARVVHAVRQRFGPGLPVIGNGDVGSPQDLAAMLGQTGCDGVMIGRAALRNPWIFALLASVLPDAVSAVVTNMPPRRERLRLIRRQFDDLCLFCGDRYAIGVFRQRIAWYKDLLGPSKPFREAVRLMQTPEDFHTAANLFDAELLSADTHVAPDAVPTMLSPA